LNSPVNAKDPYGEGIFSDLYDRMFSKDMERQIEIALKDAKDSDKDGKESSMRCIRKYLEEFEKKNPKKKLKWSLVKGIMELAREIGGAGAAAQIEKLNEVPSDPLELLEFVEKNAVPSMESVENTVNAVRKGIKSRVDPDF
jgi:hypothetical protein